MMRMFSALLSLLAAGSAAAAERCPVATAPVDAMIEKAPLIALARAVGETQPMQPAPDLRTIQNKAKDADENSGAHDVTTIKLPIQLFDVLEYIKGDGPAQLSVTTALIEQTSMAKGRTFSHDDDEFWSNPAAGRGALTENCGVAASFTPGERYLLIIGAPHVKAYEAVTSDEDPWLAYVRAHSEDN